MNRFYEAFIKYPTDKPKYADFYQRHFEGLNPSILLEIGVLKGGSHRAWKELFPNTRVVGIEIDSSITESNKDIEIYTGDQTDRLFLNHVIDTIGHPDIIIDDGGHTRLQQILSLTYLWPHLVSGGLYIIEDLETSFLDHYNDYPQSSFDRVRDCLYPLEWTGKLSGFKVGDPLTYIYSSIIFEPNICLMRKK